MNLDNIEASSRKLISIIGVALTVSLLLANTQSLYGLLSTTASVGSSGVVTTANLGIYSNSQCTNTLSSINWGTISPGGSKNTVIYVNNTGTVALTLSLSYGSWDPVEAGTYITLTWNYNGAQLNSGAVVPITLTLSVSQDIHGVTDFGVQITITGTQAS